MAPTTRASADRLPRDVLFDVLQRLPATDELCRLRTVSRPWRAVTSDPTFVRAHAAAHPAAMLFVAKFRDDPAHAYVIAAYGTVLKRVAGADGGVHVLRPRLDLACLATDWNRCRVLNTATGALRDLPPSPAPEHKGRVTLSDPYTFFTLGQVASTKEYKVLRMFNRLGFFNGGEQLFENMKSFRHRPISSEATDPTDLTIENENNDQQEREKKKKRGPTKLKRPPNGHQIPIKPVGDESPPSRLFALHIPSFLTVSPENVNFLQRQFALNPS